MTSLYKTKTVVAGKYREHYAYAYGIARGYTRKWDVVRRKEPERRADSVDRAKKAVFRTVMANAGDVRPLFVTLTYPFRNTDRASVVSDVQFFFKELKNDYRDLKYLYVVELHHGGGDNDGGYHVHIVFFGRQFVPFSDLNRIWKDLQGNGRTHIIKYNDAQHLGFYLGKYLGGDFASLAPTARLWNGSHNLLHAQILRGVALLHNPDAHSIVSESIIYNPVTNNYAHVVAFYVT